MIDHATTDLNVPGSFRCILSHSVLRHSPASALHTDVAWKAQQAKHGCAAGSTATLHRPAVTAPAGRTGLAHRALQRIVPHGVTAARPLHVRPRCLAARRHRLPRSSPQSATATARCIDSLHRFARRLAASTRCILSLVKSPHRLALHWLTASQPWDEEFLEIHRVRSGSVPVGAFFSLESFVAAF